MCTLFSHFCCLWFLPFLMKPNKSATNASRVCRPWRASRPRARARVRAHAPWPCPWVPPGAPGRGDPGPLHYHLPSGTGPLQWTPTYGIHVLATDHGLLSTECNGMWRVYALWVGVAPEWFAIQFWTSISMISCHASIESTEFPLCIV